MILYVINMELQSIGESLLYSNAFQAEIDPHGFIRRAPGQKTIKRGQLCHMGPHHEWSADGHDKLKKIGFHIWGMRDCYSGYWLGAFVVPNNRHAETIAYLYLSVVLKEKGVLCFATSSILF
jgi:hypothetical protein